MIKAKKIIITIICVFLTGCSSKSNKLSQIIESNNYEIVDVRTKEEYEELHIKGAKNIPYDLIDEGVNLDKSKIILVYCKSGRRSQIAYEILTSLGYEVYDLKAFDTIDLPKE